MTLVRGYLDCDFHADILAKFRDNELSKYADFWQCECPGGGRIQVDEVKKQLLIYGYSMGFGRCDHALTQSLIQTQMPDYEVTWNNDGY